MSKPTQTSPRSWRVEKARVTQRGRSFQLGSGSSKKKNRKTISLGVVPEALAHRAQTRLQAEENRTFGTPDHDRLFRLMDVIGREQVLEMLLDDNDEFLLKSMAVLKKSWGRRSLREYYDEVYAEHRSTKRPRTWRTEEHDWERHLLPAFGDLALDDIDEYVMDEYLTETMTKLSGAPATPNMRRKARNAMTALIKYAVRKRHRTTPRPVWFELEGTGIRSLRDKTLTVAETLALIDCAPGHEEMRRGRTWSGHKHKFQSIFACLFGQGLRPGEVAAMRWEDIDWEAGVLFVSGGEEGELKTLDSRASIRLHRLARRYLGQWWRTRGCPSSGLVHPAAAGRMYKTKGSTGFSKAFKNALSTAGITKPATPYWGRHTFATRSIEAGMSVESVAAVLRHTSVEMVRKHYDHTAATRRPDLHIADNVFGG